MTLDELIKGVQYDLDDPEATYADPDYILGFLPKTLKKLANKLNLADDAFDEQSVELPSVQAGTPSLQAYQQTGKPLAGLYNPRVVEWKLPGQDPSFYRPAEGPLDKIPDIAPPGTNALNAWGWIGKILVLSLFNVAIDIRVTGDFIPQPMVAMDDKSPFPVSVDVPLQTMLAWSIAKANGRDKLISSLGKDLEDEIDDVMIAMVKQQQGVPARRFGRMNGRPPITGPVILKQ